MVTVTLTLPPDTERVLRDRAAGRGQTLEAFLEEVAVREAVAAPEPAAAPPGDVRSWLKRLSAGSEHLPVLPGRLDRAELYADHD